MEQKKIEQRALVIGTIVNMLMGIVGLIVYRITMIESLFIDAYYTLIDLFSGLLAIFISKNSTKRTALFPNGFFILEPLYAFFKSSLLLVLLTSSVITVSIRAYKYFTTGQGEILNALPIVPYAAVMVCLCLGLSFYYKEQSKRMGNISTMLMSETKNSFIDGMISAGIGLAALLVLMIDINSPLSFLKYTGDFFITVSLVIFTIKGPISIIRSASFEIAGGTLKNGLVKKHIEKCIYSYFDKGGMIQHCFIYKIGTSFTIHLLLSEEAAFLDLKELSVKKQIILNELKQSYEFIDLNYIY
ncbi:cation transporter [Streptococcus macacae]|uniref:Cation efflux family protein n=1 Tax=Streptococcus macacae NCTC 11558 TaxID=764298 RepID=G5JV54_9STRE|nr:cation transporter [Streptococcus macacae]EHJ51524.1 cation efflux family protein [Streptococcus macacae NCTC 11558]SUN77679.1 Co/Zn/Cd cation transporter [Streptococcus macacae NCTC 11558]